MGTNGIRTRRGQLAVIKKTAYGSAFGTPVAIGEVYDFTPTPELTITSRPAATPFGGGNFKSLKGGKYYGFSFRMEVRGTGTPGAAPNFDDLLLAAALVKSVTSGSAAIGSVSARASNNGTGAPTVGGTFGHTSSGIAQITILDIADDTDIDFSTIFYPAGGGEGVGYTSTQNGDTAITLSGGPLDDVTVDFGDPSVDTDTFKVGDVYTVPLTSSSQVDTSYVPADDPGTFGSNGPALVDIQYIMDGVRWRFADCAVTFEISSDVNGPINITFTGVGKYVAEASGESFLAQTINTTPPILQKAVALTFDGSTPLCPIAFTFNPGTEANIIPCATATEGFRGGESVYQDGSGFLTLTHKVVDESFYAEFYANEVYSLSLSIGSAGNGFKITSDYAEVVEVPLSDNGGTQYITRRFNFANPGDDNPPFVITFF